MGLGSSHRLNLKKNLELSPFDNQSLRLLNLLIQRRKDFRNPALLSQRRNSKAHEWSAFIPRPYRVDPVARRAKCRLNFRKP